MFKLHLCTVLKKTLRELDAVMTRREFLMWRKVYEVYGPIHWRRDDWRFAKITDDLLGDEDQSVRDRLLTFIRESEREQTSDAEQSVLVLSGMGLSQQEIDELMKAAREGE